MARGKKEISVKNVFKILILLLLLFLTGCITKPFKYDLESLEEKVISAEIVEISELYDSVEYDLINKVDDDELSDLLNDLSMIQFFLDKPRTLSGLALKLNYIDRYELICNTRIDEYSNNNEWITRKNISVSPDEFNELILKYKIEQ